MKELIINATNDTPYVNFNKEKSHFEITGVSLPPNIFEFYQVIIDWIKNYAKNPNSETHLNFKFEYINSSSTKMIGSIIKEFEKIMNSGYNVLITWYYQKGDVEIKEIGEDFAENTSIPVFFSDY